MSEQVTSLSTRSRNIRLEGLPELLAKLDTKYLVQPEMEHAMDTFTQRVMTRRGSGLGAKRAVLAEAVTPFEVSSITSSKKNPRNTGKAWLRKNERIIGAMAPRVLAKAVERIEERWAS